MLALVLVVVWAITGPLFGFSETWQLVINTGTTIVTFLMIFLVQNSQNRDSAAIQAKLDELIRSVEAARAEFIGIEHLTDAEIEASATRSGSNAAGMSRRRPTIPWTGCCGDGDPASTLLRVHAWKSD